MFVSLTFYISFLLGNGTKHDEDGRDAKNRISFKNNGQ